MNNVMRMPESLDAFVASLRQYGVMSCEIHGADGVSLRLRFADSGEAGQAAGPSEAMSTPGLPAAGVLRSDGMGFFTREHPFLVEETLGSKARRRHVGAGEVVGFLRDGELLQAVTAPTACRLVECCVQDGDLVGYGQPLYRVDPSDQGKGVPV